MPSRADDAEYGTGRGHQRVSYMRKQRYVGVSTLAIHVCGKCRRSVRQCALLGDRVVRGHVRVIELHVLHVLCRHGGETFDRNTGVIRNFIAPLPRMKLCSIGLSQSRTVFVSGLPHNDAAVYTGTALRGSMAPYSGTAAVLLVAAVHRRGMSAKPTGVAYRAYTVGEPVSRLMADCGMS